MTQRAIVIGAGLGGLATALRLQCAGFQCTVLEAGSSPGGKMNRLQKGGFTFDTGPSLITMPWVFEDLFQSAGSRLEDHAQLIPLDPIADYRFEDGTRFEYTSHLPAWLATLKRIAPRDTTGFFEFMSLGARLFSVSRETFFKRSPRTPRPAELAHPGRPPPPPRLGRLPAYRQPLLPKPASPRTLRPLSHLVGSSPDHCPATLAVIPYVEFAFGGYAVKGGLYRIVEGIVALARLRGVELRLNSPVARIVTEKGKAKGVELESGERLAADVVIMNGDHAATPQLLGHPAPPLRHRSLSGFVMLFGLNRPLNVHQHTVCFTGAEMVYVNAPEGANTLFVMANAPPIGKQWDEAGMTAAARARVFDSLRRAGFPDFTSDIAVSDIWTPARFEADYRMPSGSIYGTDSHGWRNAFLRPPNKNRAVQGLYHAGGSTHPGGGTPTVLMSAEITSRLIAQRHT